MSRIFIDGFESGTYDLWDSVSGSATISSGISGMDGTYCIYMSDNSNTSKNITAISTLYGAFIIKNTVAPSSTYELFTLFNGSQIMINFKRNITTGYIEVYRGTTLLATGTKPLNLNTVNLFEFYVYIDDVAGRTTTKLNDITDIDFTGDTKTSTQTTIDRIYCGCGATGGSYANFRGYYDNVILDNANWIGDSKIQAMVPNDAGTATTWTPSVGANYTCVDEIPSVDTDFVETNTLNALDTYTVSNLTGTIGSIKCVQVQARALAEGAPTPPDIQLAVRSGGADYFSTDKQVQSVSYKGLFNIWETDPATAVAWTESGVNAAEIGQKAVA